MAYYRLCSTLRAPHRSCRYTPCWMSGAAAVPSDSYWPTVDYGICVGSPTRLEYWVDTITAYVNAMVARYGQDEVGAVGWRAPCHWCQFKGRLVHMVLCSFTCASVQSCMSAFVRANLYACAWRSNHSRRRACRVALCMYAHIGPCRLKNGCG